MLQKGQTVGAMCSIIQCLARRVRRVTISVLVARVVLIIGLASALAELIRWMASP